MIKLLAPIAKYAGLFFGGIIGWVSGFFGSDSIKNLTWVIAGVAMLAALVMAWVFIKRG